MSKDQIGGQKSSFLRILQKSSRLSWNGNYGLTEEDLQFNLVWFRWVLFLLIILVLLLIILEDIVDKRTETKKASVIGKSD